MKCLSGYINNLLTYHSTIIYVGNLLDIMNALNTQCSYFDTKLITNILVLDEPRNRYFNI